MTHTISDDGKTQTIKGTETKPDGTTSDFNVVWKRLGSGSGWGGTWEEADVKFTSPDEWDIEAYDGNGLTFNTPAYQDTLSMKFDGKDTKKRVRRSRPAPCRPASGWTRTPWMLRTR